MALRLEAPLREIHDFELFMYPLLEDMMTNQEALKPCPFCGADMRGEKEREEG